MEETNFVLLWKEHYEKIDQSLVLNKQLLKEVVNLKAAKAMQSLKGYNKRGIVAVIIYLIVLGFILFVTIANYSSAANYFLVSFGAIFLINLKALYDYIKHLVWINNIDYDGSVTEIQEKLAQLKLSIIHHGRFMFLQIPFWTTFQLSNKWFPQNVAWYYIVLQLACTLASIYLAYWLYKNLTIENMHKKWVRTMIEGEGGKSITEALEFYKELEEFKK